MSEKLRVYLLFDEATSCAANPDQQKVGRPTLKHKVILATKEDQTSTCGLLVTKFCEKYNAQEAVTANAEKFKLNPDQLQLQLASTLIKSTAHPITNYISDYNDVNVVFLPPAEAPKEHEPGSVPCTNFGCGKRFVPGRDDKEETCEHHAGKPVFHDVYKYWSCCKDKKTMDFDEFEKIPACAKGFHKHNPMSAAIAVSGGGSLELDRKPLTEEEIRALDEKNNNKPTASPVVAQQEDDTNSGAPVRGPREFNATKTSEPGKPIDDKGNYRCRRHGCGKVFHPSENNDTACNYHTQGPVFWDTQKFWACCKDKKCSDFDDFAKVPTCAVGEHLI